MAFNVLSGSITAHSLIASGSFSGSFRGNGGELDNVKQFELQNQGDQRLVFYKLVNGEYQLNSNSGLTFNSSANTLIINGPKVGIGTTSPTNLLTVAADLSSGTNAGIHVAADLDDDAFIDFTEQGGSSIAAFGSTDAYGFRVGYEGGAGEEHLSFKSGNEASTNNRMVIKRDTGYVGIGTATPSALLEVSGDLKIGTSITASTISLTGLSAGTATTSSYLAVDSNNRIVLTSSAGGGGGGGGSGAVSAVSNGSDNRVATFASSDSLNGEANLTFDGSTFSIQGGVVFKRRQITSSITASTTDYYIGVSASAAISIRMPNAATLVSGQTFVIKDERGSANTHNITVLASGSQLIDGNSSVLLESPYTSISIYTNGTDKFFIY